MFTDQSYTLSKLHLTQTCLGHWQHIKLSVMLTFRVGMTSLVCSIKNMVGTNQWDISELVMILALNSTLQLRKIDLAIMHCILNRVLSPLKKIIVRNII